MLIQTPLLEPRPEIGQAMVRTVTATDMLGAIPLIWTIPDVKLVSLLAGTSQPNRLLEFILDVGDRSRATTPAAAQGDVAFSKDQGPARTYREALATRPSDRLVGRLRNYKQLSHNWNGYDGDPPPDGAVEQCVDFLRSLGDILLPTPMVSGSGEVGLFWEREGVTIELGFKGKDKYGYLVELPDGRCEEDEDVPVSEIRPVLREALAALTHA